MREIIYDVAVSLDGFIAADGGDVSAFPQAGPHADAYFQRLEGYGTTLMGRTTYEFGYRYGLEPGQRAYPHMDHYVFSTGIELPIPCDVTVVRAQWRAKVLDLRGQPGDPIYLCGGGKFAGWMLSEDLIDRLRLKIAPIILGRGIPLLGSVQTLSQWQRVGVTAYDNGVTLVEFTRG